MSCRKFSSNPGLGPLDTSDMPPHYAKCPTGGRAKSCLVKNHCVRGLYVLLSRVRANFKSQQFGILNVLVEKIPLKHSAPIMSLP